MQQKAGYLTISVTFERREDGGLRVYSDDVPGLVLSGPDPVAVFEDVVPALERLFEHNKGLRAVFEPTVDVETFLEKNGFLPPPEQSGVRVYVAALALANDRSPTLSA